MTSLTVNLFGQSETTVDQQTPLSFRTAKAQALLFYLLVEPQQTFYREKLMTLLWPDAALKSAQTSLRQAIYQLRHTLPRLDNLQGGPAVALVNTTRFTVERHPHAAVFVDVEAFQNALREVDRHGHETLSGCYACRQALEVATTLYRGPFLVNLSLHDCEPFDAWIRDWRTMLERQALDAFHTLTDLHLRDNECEQAAELARRQLTLDPFAERALRQLLTAGARCGRRTEALADLESYCALLQKELQTTPEATTLALADRIRAGQTLHQFPVLAQRDNGIPTLPPPGGRFVGRTPELAELQRLLEVEKARLLTITGPGGMGKTSLALAAAHNMRQSFPDGMALIPIPPGTTALTLPRLIVTQLQLPAAEPNHSTPALLERLITYMRPRTMLLLLDSFEQAHDCESLLETLLSAAPGITLLVTSRRVPRPPSGQIFPLHGLDYPTADVVATRMHQFSAPRLLRQAALRTNPFLVWGLDAWAAAGEISRLVGGMPLALELAASWAHALPLDVVAAEIRRGLDILATDAQSLPVRHRSIAVVLSASWQQLPPEERVFCNRVSRFRGGFTREAAAEIAAPMLARTRLLRILAHLLERSLLTYDSDRDRYSCHDLLRQYGAQQLAESADQEADVRRRHSEFYVKYLCEQGAALRGSDQQAGIQRISLELPNIEAAWIAAADAALWPMLTDALPALALFCRRQPDQDTGIALLQTLLAQIESAPQDEPVISRLACRAWIRLAALLLIRGHNDRAGDALRCATELLNRPPLEAAGTRFERAIHALTTAELHLATDRQHALAAAKQAVTLFRDLDDLDGIADALSKLGQAYHALHELAAAEAAFAEAIALHTSFDDRPGLANVLVWQGLNATRSGQFDEARQLLNRAVDLRQGLGDAVGHAVALRTLGVVLFWSGEHRQARAQLFQSYLLLQDTGLSFELGYVLAFLSVAELFCGNYQTAAARAEQMIALGRQIESWRDLGVVYWVMGVVAQLDGSTERAAVHLEESLALFSRVTAAGEKVFALASLASVRLTQGRADEARDLLRQSLTPGGYAAAVFSLRGWAALAYFAGEDRCFLELVGQMGEHGLTNSALDRDLFATAIAAVRHRLGDRVIDEAMEAGRRRQIGDVIAAAAHLCGVVETPLSTTSSAAI